MKLDVFGVGGEKMSEVEISDNIFKIEPHNQAMISLINSERASLRQGTHSTKTRAQVRGGGRKPWRQKGTGRARQGSIRSPQWRGGGVVFGPTPERNYTLKVNKKVKDLAIKSGWSYKASEKAFKIIDNLDFKNPSSRDFRTFLENIKAQNLKILLVIQETDTTYNLFLSSRNFENVLPMPISQILLDDILNSDLIVMTEKTIKEIEERLQNETQH